MAEQNKPLSYKDAGVDIDAGNQLVERIKSVTKKTHRPEGVGTKLRLAMDENKHDGIGIDLVAMCVNDLIVQGAEPLFFLDYYATGKLDVDTATRVVTGIGEGCQLAGCALIGGETAEMPGMYDGEDYDVAGFCVGVVEAEDVIDGSNVATGNKLIALASSGPHSNGYSLIRKIIEVSQLDLSTNLNGKTISDHLLEPTRIYVKAVLNVLESFKVNAISHITGGGFWENIPRVLPDNMQAVVDGSSWQWPAIFELLQEKGNVTTHEMYRTFNCGVGLILAVEEEDAQAISDAFNDLGENAWIIGDIKQRQDDQEQVVINN